VGFQDPLFEMRTFLAVAYVCGAGALPRDTALCKARNLEDGDKMQKCVGYLQSMADFV
jgi:hypothetical protein